MIRFASIACGFAVLLAEVGWSQDTQRVNVGYLGQESGDASGISISANGRFVAFDSDASNLVAGDTNGLRDVFVRDRVFGTTQLVSVSSTGTQGDSVSSEASISSDGRFVVFHSLATNLVSGDTNGLFDTFVRDLEQGATERVSVSSAGAEGDGTCFTSAISAGGRFVTFASTSSNLVPGDTNSAADVFVRDRFLQVTERVSVFPNGAQGNFLSDAPSISANGRFVAFESLNLFTSPDSNGGFDVFVRDRLMGTTVRVSQPSMLFSANGESMSPSISSDGRYVAFGSWASNLVGGDTNSAPDVFVRRRTGGSVERVSVSSTGAEGDADTFATLGAISDDGRYICFSSFATNLVSGDTNSKADVFLRDRELGVTERLSVDSAGNQGDNDTYECSISSDGRSAAFVSYASNLVGGDTNGLTDAFVRDRVGGPILRSLCHPGYGGVIGCPCANPPSGAGPGCNNQSNTGGAILSAAGAASLSFDTLTFTTNGEVPTAASYVAQGTVGIESGLPWGQGVRCIGGYMRRLYTKNATGGSITAPDFGAGDPSVSARSAAVGDTIQPGQSRWYLVYYRDVLSLCGSVINMTQTGEVVWGP